MANLPPKRPFTISIEGNIAAGKSTLLDYLDSNPEITVLKEPVHRWRNVARYNLLERMYNDPIRHAHLSLIHI